MNKQHVRQVQCYKLGQLLPGLEQPPYPGALGERIYQHISQQAWRDWINNMTKLINEGGLSPAEIKDQQYLEQAMIRFLFPEAD
jgi:Fe-S cluster biosynthesis and repair protein YggX